MRILLLLVCLGLPITLLPQEIPPTVRMEQLRQCKTPKEVRQLMGRPPDRIARQIFYRGRVEQWVYDRPLPCRIEILYQLGEDPLIQSIRHREP